MVVVFCCIHDVVQTTCYRIPIISGPHGIASEASPGNVATQFTGGCADDQGSGEERGSCDRGGTRSSESGSDHGRLRRPTSDRHHSVPFIVGGTILSVSGHAYTCYVIWHWHILPCYIVACLCTLFVLIYWCGNYYHKLMS